MRAQSSYTRVVAISSERLNGAVPEVMNGHKVYLEATWRLTGVEGRRDGICFPLPGRVMVDARITDQDIAILCDVSHGRCANLNADKRRFWISRDHIITVAR